MTTNRLVSISKAYSYQNASAATFNMYIARQLELYARLDNICQKKIHNTDNYPVNKSLFEATQHEIKKYR